MESRCPWDRLKKNDWLLLLAIHPSLKRHLAHPELLTLKTAESYWGRLLAAQPKFAADDLWTQLHQSDWIDIIVNAPQYISHVPDSFWPQLNGRDWTTILMARGELLRHYDSKLQRSRRNDFASAFDLAFTDPEPNWGKIRPHSQLWRTESPISI